MQERPDFHSKLHIKPVLIFGLLAAAFGSCNIYTEQLLESSPADAGGGSQAGSTAGGLSGGSSDGDAGHGNHETRAGDAGTNGSAAAGAGDDSGGSGAMGDGGATGGVAANGGTGGKAGATAGGGTGGTGAATATGGSAGASGQGEDPTAGVAGDSGGGGSVLNELLIDNMENPNNSILTHGGRRGFWYSFDDGTTGSISPAPDEDFQMELLGEPRTQDSAYALHCVVTGFSDWGAGVGLNLNAAGGTRESYDASAYVGLKFWARAEDSASANGEMAPRRLYLRVVDALTAPDGAMCDPDPNAASGTACNDHFYVAVDLNEEWTEHTISFEAAQQEGWGKQYDAPDLSAVYGFQFVAPADLDFWLDDLEFVSN